MIKAYTIHHIGLDLLTNQYELIRSFAQGDDIISGMRCLKFNNKNDLIEYTFTEQRDWIINALSKFVKHKTIIIMNSAEPASEQVSISLEKSQKFVNLISEKKPSIITICKSLRETGLDHLQAILPNINNNSHESSLRDLNEIKLFVSTELTNLLK